MDTDYNFDWTNEFHIFRMVSDGKNTTVYLDEQQVATIIGTSTDEDNGRFFEWGNSSGSTVYGAYIDWIAINKTGGFAPSAGNLPALPPDIALAIDENAEVTETTTTRVRVIPNPGQEAVSLSGENWNQQTIQVQLFDTTGKQISSLQTYEITDNQLINLPTRQLKKGVYYIVIQPQKGRREVVKWIKI